MDLKQIGYYLYMDKCEKEQRQRTAQQEVNVNSKSYLAGDQTTNTQRKDNSFLDPEIHPRPF